MGSSEYNLNYAIANVQAVTAWDHGATGQGILVGVIDDGVQANAPEIDANISPLSLDINSGRNQLFSTSDTHGTELAALIGGEYNDASTVGVAFHATILSIRADNGSGGFTNADLAAAIDYAIAQHVRVINFSLGSDGPPNSVSPTFANAIKRATDAGIIIVNSSGNEAAAQVNYPGYLSINNFYSNDLMLVVGAHTPTGVMASFSNVANDVQSFYLTAPGTQIIVPDFGAPGPTDPAYQLCGPPTTATGACLVQGTSYSAPIVTGAVALLLEAFPGLTPQQIVQLVLTSTDDAGAPGVDAVWGHGRLNIAKAFAPVGPVAAPLPQGGFVYPGETVLGMTGAAFGDAFQRGAWSAVGFDSFGRAFRIDLGANWRAAETSRLSDAPLMWRAGATEWGAAAFAAADEIAAPDSLRRALGEAPEGAFLAEVSAGPGLSVAFGAHASLMTQLSPAPVEGHFSLAAPERSARVTRALTDHVALSLLTEEGRYLSGPDYARGERRAEMARVQSGFGRWRFAAAYGALTDDAGLLGLAWTEARGAAARAETRISSFEFGYDVSERLRLGFVGEWGLSSLAPGGWLTQEAPIRTSAFSIAARMAATPLWLLDRAPNGEGAFTLALSQPLRVEDGAFGVDLPTADAYGVKHLSYEHRLIDAAPSGRELDFSLGYAYALRDRVNFTTTLTQAFQPGHRRDAEPAQYLQIGLRLRR